MNATENTQIRLLTPVELAVIIKTYREIRKWSQEQLAEISGLNVRTIQRVEQGKSASLDTRRALARAFDAEDIDTLNKPITILSEEELKAEKEKFEREYVTLTATPLTTGKQLAKLAEVYYIADISEPAFELTREADEAFSILVDYFRDYRDCADLYSETQKLEVYDEMQSQIGSLKKFGVSLRYAEHKIQVWGSGPDSKPISVNVLYVVGFPIGQEPEQFITLRPTEIGLYSSTAL